jgi:hypothetical protein
MAHYAFIDEKNIVTQVIVGKDETELIDGMTPEEWYGNFWGQTCIRTSYNAKIRFNYAGIGFTYDPIDDAFISPAPCEHEELSLNDDKHWECTNEEHKNVLP